MNKIMKQQADRNFKNISRIHLSIMNDRLKNEIRQRLESWSRIGVKNSELRQWNNLLDLLLNKEPEKIEETQKRELLLAGKCSECGQQKYGFSRDNKDRITDLFFKQFAYQDASDPTGSTWIFRKDLDPNDVLEQILEAL